MRTAPIYRSDIKGQVAEYKRECAECMRNQIATADFFLLLAEDAPAYEEYAVYLTDDELRACFKAAQRPA